MPKRKPAAREEESPAQPLEEDQSELPSEAISEVADSAEARENNRGTWFDDKPTPGLQAKPMISLRYAYQGRPSKGRAIVAGDYARDDPALFGLANYLLKTGQAEIVEEA